MLQAKQVQVTAEGIVKRAVLKLDLVHVPLEETQDNLGFLG